jgi:adenylate cyclase
MEGARKKVQPISEPSEDRKAEPHFQFKLGTAAKVFYSLVDSFVEDYMIKKYVAEKSGWRTVAEIAQKAHISTSILYGRHSDLPPTLDEPIRRGLIETRIFPGERGRGGEVRRFRIAYEKEPVEEFVNAKVRRGRNISISSEQKKVPVIMLSQDTTAVLPARHRPGVSEFDKHRIAVLPFANFSPETGDQYLADGITEELISTMSKISGLKVIARTSVMAFKDKQKGIDEIASELKVGTILEGSVRKSGDRLRITVQLIDSGSSDHLWSESYDREMKDVFAIQSDISQTIAHALKVRLLSFEKGRIETEPTKNIEAHAMCLRGIYYNINQIDFRKAIEYFQKAIDLDPGYALSYAWLSDSYGRIGGFGLAPAEELLLKIKEAAEKALRLDPNLAEAHASLAWDKYFRHDWGGMERELRRALELNPRVAEAREYLSALLDWTGKFDEAYTEARKALEINPLSRFATLQAMGLLLFNMREYDKAIEHLNKVLKFDPDFKQIHNLIGWCYFQKSMFQKAIEEFQKNLEPSKGKNDVNLIDIACAYAKLRRREECLEILKHFEELSKKQFVPAAYLARVNLALGDKEKVLYLLENAYQKGEYNTWINVNPIYDEVRPDPRFKALVKKMGLEG